MFLHQRNARQQGLNNLPHSQVLYHNILPLHFHKQDLRFRVHRRVDAADIQGIEVMFQLAELIHMAAHRVAIDMAKAALALRVWLRQYTPNHKSKSRHPWNPVDIRVEVLILFRLYSNKAIPDQERILKIRVSKASLREIENVTTLQCRRLDVKNRAQKGTRHDVLASETTGEIRYISGTRQSSNLDGKAFADEFPMGHETNGLQLLSILHWSNMLDSSLYDFPFWPSIRFDIDCLEDTHFIAHVLIFDFFQLITFCASNFSKHLSILYNIFITCWRVFSSCIIIFSRALEPRGQCHFHAFYPLCPSSTILFILASGNRRAGL